MEINERSLFKQVTLNIFNDLIQYFYEYISNLHIYRLKDNY